MEINFVELFILRNQGSKPSKGGAMPPPLSILLLHLTLSPLPTPVSPNSALSVCPLSVAHCKLPSGVSSDNSSSSARTCSTAPPAPDQELCSVSNINEQIRQTDMPCVEVLHICLHPKGTDYVSFTAACSARFYQPNTKKFSKKYPGCF